MSIFLGDKLVTMGYLGDLPIGSFDTPIQPIPLPLDIDYLLVAGGGGGGGNDAGGGGAGGLVSGSIVSLTPDSYPITVGLGGGGGTNGGGGTGGNTIFNSITALGGGGGGTRANVGANGGCGGGGGNNNSSGGTGSQGGNGGSGAPDLALQSAGGGGGGAGGNGTNSTTAIVGGNGGNGTTWVDGTTYAGGGGGGFASGGSGGNSGAGGGGTGSHASPTSGVDGLGGGGGGAGAANTQAGSGGDGVAIIRYLGTPQATGGTITEDVGYTYHTFTASGDFFTIGTALLCETYEFFGGSLGSVINYIPCGQTGSVSFDLPTNEFRTICVAKTNTPPSITSGNGTISEQGNCDTYVAPETCAEGGGTIVETYYYNWQVDGQCYPTPESCQRLYPKQIAVEYVDINGVTQQVTFGGPLSGAFSGTFCAKQSPAPFIYGGIGNGTITATGNRCQFVCV